MLGKDCRRRKQTKLASHDHFSWTMLSVGTSSWYRKDTLDDEIKLAGLEALVLEELEKHFEAQLESLANV